MHILCVVGILLGFIFLTAAFFISKNNAVRYLIYIGFFLFLFSYSKIEKLNKGKPASSLDVLTVGEKYEVVDVYEKYIIVKSVADADNEKLRLIGPLDFGTMTTGRYNQQPRSRAAKYAVIIRRLETKTMFCDVSVCNFCLGF